MEHHAGHVRRNPEKYQGVDTPIGQQYLLIDYHSVNQALAPICRMIFLENFICYAAGLYLKDGINHVVEWRFYTELLYNISYRISKSLSI